METQHVIIALIIGLLILAVIGFAVFSKLYQADKDSDDIFNKTINENLNVKSELSHSYNSQNSLLWANIYISPKQTQSGYYQN